MKDVSRILGAGLGIFGLTVCSQPAETNSTETPVEETVFLIDTTLVDPIDTIITENDQQTLLDDFLLQFKESESLPSIRYSNAYEYEASREHYHYDGEQLKSIFIDHGIEGGGGGHLRVLCNYQPDGSMHETVLYVPYYADDYEKGFFSYVKDGQTLYLEVSGNEDFYHPKIVGPTTEKPAEQSGYLDVDLIYENTAKFELKSGFYSWDIRREKVNSEYGEIEIYENIEVDTSIFRTRFLPGK